MSGEDSGVDAGSESDDSVSMSLQSDNEQEDDDELFDHQQINHNDLGQNNDQQLQHVNPVNKIEMVFPLLTSQPSTSQPSTSQPSTSQPSTSQPSTSSQSQSSSQSSFMSLSSFPSITSFPTPKLKQSLQFFNDNESDNNAVPNIESKSCPIKYDSRKNLPSPEQLKELLKKTITIPNLYYTENTQHELCRKMKSNRIKHRTELKLRCTPLRSKFLTEKLLRNAANNNDIQVAKELLEEGVDPKSYDERNRTALHLAVCKGHSQIVKLLLEYGADPNQKDVVGNTPLHLAACINKIDIITLLLKAGTDINSSDNCGRTPLNIAQAKLKLLQSNTSTNSYQLKNEVLQVVEMMLIYLQRSGKNAEVDLLSAFSSRLNLHQTKEEVDCDLKDLLSSLNHLSLSQ